MPEMLTDPIKDRRAWTGRDASLTEESVFTLSKEVCDELANAVEIARQNGLTVPDFGHPQWGSEQFAVPSLDPVVDAILKELEDGLGFVRLQGLDIDDYEDVAALAALFWGLNSRMGIPVSQSVKQDYLGHVRNEGGEIVSGHYRGFKSAKASPFHTDNCDVASLFCIKGARVGGQSSVVSGAQIHNDLLETAPESLPVLYNSFYGDWRGEEPEGWDPYFSCPIFSYYQGRLSIWGGTVQIRSAQEKYPSLPRLSAAQSHALEELDRAADRHRYDFSLNPGEVFFFNNYAVLHARTAYEDHAGSDLRRHLMRVWLSVPNARPLQSTFVERYGPVREGGPRGGYGGSHGTPAVI